MSEVKDLNTIERELLVNSHTSNNNESIDEAIEYINKASDYLKKINDEKYKFEISNKGLKYRNPKTGNEETLTDEYEITNALAKFICDDYYYSINMPDKNNPVFSSGTESDEEIKKLNQNRNQRDVHGSVHVYGVAVFVAELLNKLKFNPELTLKDKIIAIVCAYMHDSCRKGEGVDHWDNDSAILATRLLQHFGLNGEEDKEYLKEIMEYVGDKDGDWKIKKDDTKNKQNKAKIIATLVDLGDTEEVYRVRTNFDIDFFLSKIKKIGVSIDGYLNEDGTVNLEKQKELVQLLARFHVILAETKGVLDNKFTCLNSELTDAYTNEIERITGRKELSLQPMQEYGALRSEEIIYNREKIAKKHLELLKTEEFKSFVNLSMEDTIKELLFTEYTSKPLTEKQTKESFEAIKELREENIYFLLKGCDSITYTENIKEIYNETNTIINNIEEEKEDKIKYKLHKVEINEQTYIIRETIYENRFVDEDKKVNYKKFNIFKDKDLNEIKTEEDIKSLQKVDEEDIKYMINSISGKIVEKEKEFQLKRIKRLYSFIDNLFDKELAKQIEEKLKKSIEILFDNEKTIEEKFEAKETLASLLRIIKTSYKKDKEFTDHYLMLTDVCNAETLEELKKELDYLLTVGTARIFYTERVKENKLKQVENNVIFRGLKINLSNITEDIFKNTDPLGFKTFDVYHGRKDYCDTEEYSKRQIGFTITRGNITSFSTDSNISINGYISSENEGILFVCGISEERKEIIGTVQRTDNNDKEVNTFRLESQDVAFALKMKNGGVFDVLFNNNYNGEFYIGNELVSQNELKEKILGFGNNTNGLIDFLNKEFKTTKLIEKSEEEVEREIKSKENDIQEQDNNVNLNIPKQFQDVMFKLIEDNNHTINNENNTTKLNRLNTLIEIHYNSLSLENKELTEKELTKEEINKLLEADNEYYITYVYDKYKNPINVDLLLKYYTEFDKEKQSDIISIVQNYINKLIKDNKSESIDKKTEEENNQKIIIYFKKIIEFKPDLKQFNIEINGDIFNILLSCNSFSNFMNLLKKFGKYDELFIKYIEKILEKYFGKDLVDLLQHESLHDESIRNTLFTNDNIDKLINLYIKKGYFSKIPKLISILSKTKQGEEYLFGKSGKIINRLINSYINKKDFFNLPELINVLNEIKQGKKYLFDKDAKINNLINPYIEHKYLYYLPWLIAVLNEVVLGKKYLSINDNINILINSYIDKKDFSNLPELIKTLTGTEQGIDYLFSKNGKIINRLINAYIEKNDLINLIELIDILNGTEQGIDYLFSENGKIINRLIDSYIEKKYFSNLPELIKALTETEQGIDYLFSENGKIINKLINLYTKQNYLYFLPELIDTLTKTDKGKDYLFIFGENEKIIDVLINLYIEKKNFSDQSKLINALIKTDDGKDYLFGNKDTKGKIEELIDSYIDKENFSNLSKLINKLSETKEIKDYLFGKNGKIINKFFKTIKDKEKNLNNLLVIIDGLVEHRNELQKEQKSTYDYKQQNIESAIEDLSEKLDEVLQEETNSAQKVVKYFEYIQDKDNENKLVLKLTKEGENIVKEKFNSVSKGDLYIEKFSKIAEQYFVINNEDEQCKEKKIEELQNISKKRFNRIDKIIVNSIFSCFSSLEQTI